MLYILNRKWVLHTSASIFGQNLVFLHFWQVIVFDGLLTVVVVSSMVWSAEKLLLKSIKTAFTSLLLVLFTVLAVNQCFLVPTLYNSFLGSFYLNEVTRFRYTILWNNAIIPMVSRPPLFSFFLFSKWGH